MFLKDAPTKSGKSGKVSKLGKAIYPSEQQRVHNQVQETMASATTLIELASNDDGLMSLTQTKVKKLLEKVEQKLEGPVRHILTFAGPNGDDSAHVELSKSGHQHVTNLEMARKKLSSLESLVQAMAMVGELEGAATCVLACAIHAKKAGVLLADKVADTIIHREVTQCIQDDNIDWQELAQVLMFSPPGGLSAATTCIDMSLYNSKEVAYKKQAACFREIVTGILSTKTAAPLDSDLKLFLDAFHAAHNGNLAESTAEELSALQLLLGIDPDAAFSRGNEGMATAAMQTLQNSRLLGVKPRGELLCSKIKAAIRQRIVDERCTQNLSALTIQIDGVAQRMKLKSRNGCCMVSIVEHIRLLEPSVELQALISAEASKAFSTDNAGAMGAAVTKLATLTDQLVDTQREQQWGLLTKIAQGCVKAMASSFSQKDNDDLVELFTAPALQASLKDTKASDISRLLIQASRRNEVDDAIACANAALSNLKIAFSAAKEKLDTEVAFTTALSTAMTKLAECPLCPEKHAADFSNAIASIHMVLSCKAAEFVQHIVTSKFMKNIAGIEKLEKAKEVKAFHIAAIPREISVTICDEAVGCWRVQVDGV